VINIQQIRKDFPILHQTTANGKPLVYLDSAATTQKPQIVIDALNEYYNQTNANIHRGVYDLAQKATEQYEAARHTVQDFINAAFAKQIVFVKGTTEAVNIVADSFVAPHLDAGDNVVISAMEHHANLVPWQQLCFQKGAELRVIPMNKKGELILDSLPQMIDERSKMVAVVHISNSLGTINPIEKIIAAAHEKEVPVLIDGAQSVAHQPIDVQALDCDFFVFSGHKLFGPTGIGVLYGKEEHLEKMKPYQYGGDMIKMVSFEKTIFNSLPQKLEAGTPNIAGAISLAKAIEYTQSIGLKNIQQYTSELLQYATEKLLAIEGLRMIGQAKHKSSILSFLLDDIHPHDMGTILNDSGIAIRVGHHCTQPAMQFFEIPGTARASFSMYNTMEEIDHLAKAVMEVKGIFG